MDDQLNNHNPLYQVAVSSCDSFLVNTCIQSNTRLPIHASKSMPLPNFYFEQHLLTYDFFQRRVAVAGLVSILSLTLCFNHHSIYIYIYCSVSIDFAHRSRSTVVYSGLLQQVPRQLHNPCLLFSLAVYQSISSMPVCLSQLPGL